MFTPDILVTNDHLESNYSLFSNRVGWDMIHKST